MTPTRTRTLHRARIEIIPLIDVIFFLLATFVLFTLSLNRIGAIPLTFPRVEAIPAPPDANRAIILTAAPGGMILWDGAPVAAGDLPARLALLRETSPDPRVLITGEAQASYGAAIRLLDEVRLAGITQVSMQTRVQPRAGAAP